MAALTRSVVDSYYMLFYLAIDRVEEETREFRFLLWDYHSEVQRLKMLRLIRSTRPELHDLEKNIACFKESLVKHPIYLSQSLAHQSKFKKGDMGIFATNSMLSKRAGIDPAYYKAVYVFLSNYVHAYPFSLDQLATFRAGTEEALRLIKVVIEYCTAYVCLGVRDFLQLCPDQRSSVDPDTAETIDTWCSIVREFSAFGADENPHA